MAILTFPFSLQIMFNHIIWHPVWWVGGSGKKKRRLEEVRLKGRWSGGDWLLMGGWVEVGKKRED